MSIAFGNGVTAIQSFWTTFKATAIAKGLLMQYQNDGTIYTVFAFDGPQLCYFCIIWDGNVPDGIQPSYSQSQNNTDLTDFTTNWQNKTNQPVGGQVQVSNFILNAGTITASGSTVVAGLTSSYLSLVINITAAPSGTAPTLTFSIQDIDPVNQTTTIGSATTGSPITGIAATELTASTLSSAVKISWALGGTSTPTFTGVNVSLAQKQANATITGTITATQGTAAALSGAWPSEITDGSHGPVAVKAASTAAVATDPALVVAISPNNTIATSNLSVGPTGSPPPADASYIGGFDGTNLTGLKLKPASTAAVATDPSLVTALSPNTPLPAGSNALGSVSVTGTTAVSAASLPLPAGAATSANQTTIGTQTTEINDGTRTATIKAASTAAVAADTSLVVGLSPNSPLPAGTNALGSVTVTGTPAISGTVTSNQGTPNTTANSWPTTVTDGSHGPAAVKAASTAAVATDPALVVAVSPNNAVAITAAALPLPTGAATSANQTTIGTQTTEINDGTRTATIKAASTAAVAADTALVVGLSPNSALPAGSNALGSVSVTGTTAISAAALPLPAGAATSANQTTLGSQTTKINDGTNTAAVKAASTAAVATDPALVVGLSPNSPLPAGTNALGSVTVTGTPAISGTVTANQGTPAATANSWPTTVTDGTHGPAAVKAASTAAAAADPALVVAVSPNNTVATTQSGTWTNTVTQATAANLNATVTGSGVAGTPAAGVVSVQGVSGGTALPVSGTVTATNPSVGTTGTTTPTSATLVGGTDGTNLVALKIKDASTAAVAADPSLVTAFSPNSPLPAGTNALGSVTVTGTPAISGTVTANQGTPNTTANSWPTTVTDGTHGPAAVKAASTAAIATDPALVVGFSPNSPLPTGTNTIGNVNVNGLTNLPVSGVNAIGTAPTMAPVFVAGYDGTDIVALRFKDASTAAVATDPSLVVALSPNSPAEISDGTNGIVGVAPANGTPTTSQPALVISASPNSWDVPEAYSGFQPAPLNVPVAPASLQIDGAGRLEGHTAVLTDEGSLRDDFTGTTLTTTLTGTPTWTNGSTTVTGSGTAFTTQVGIGQYIRRTSDGEADYAQVASVQSATSLTLASPYAGTSGASAGVVSNWATNTGTGGSIAVATSIATIASGTTASSVTQIIQAGDYLPYTAQFYVAVSQRIANQTLYIGFQQTPGATPAAQATVQFTGTTNTTVNFVTAFSSQATDQTSTAVTLPNSGVTSGYHLYSIQLSSNQASLSIDGVVVAINDIHLPSPYQVLNVVCGVANAGTAPGSTTSMTIDLVYFANYDRVQIDNDFTGEPLPSSIVSSSGTQVSVQDRSAMTAGSQFGLPVMGQSGGVGRLITVNRLGFVVPGYQTLQALDVVEGTTVNTWLWTESTTTMTIAQTTGVLTLNNAAITTNATSAIITSTRQFPIINQASLVCSFKALITQTTNAVNEIGFGTPTGATAVVNNGAFFRVSASGQIKAVISFNGTETVSAVLATIVTTSYYVFEVEIGDDGARFIMEDANGIPLVDTSLNLSLTTSGVTALSHIPAFARVYTSGTAGTAPQTKISSFQCWQMGVNTSKPWEQQLAGAGRGGSINPTTFAQTASSMTAAPATETPSNTVAGYNTLGGDFATALTTASENPLSVFAFQIPSPYTFYLTEVSFSVPFVTTTIGVTGVPILEWLLIHNNTNGNISTGGGQKFPLGLNMVYQSATQAAGSFLTTQGNLTWNPDVPVICLPGTYLHIAYKVFITSAAATPGVTRGSVYVDGFFE